MAELNLCALKDHIQYICDVYTDILLFLNGKLFNCLDCLYYRIEMTFLLKGLAMTSVVNQHCIKKLNSIEIY